MKCVDCKVYLITSVMFEKHNQCAMDRIMQDSTGHSQLGAWFERDDIAEKIHAGDHGELETGSHPE